MRKIQRILFPDHTTERKLSNETLMEELKPIVTKKIGFEHIYQYTTINNLWQFWTMMVPMLGSRFINFQLNCFLQP